MKADSLLQMKLYEEARSIYADLKLRYPNWSPAHFGYIKSLADRVSIGEQAMAWRDAIARFPASSAPFRALVACLQSHENKAKSLQELEILAEHPKHGWSALRALGMLAEAEKRYSDAAAHFRASLSQNAGQIDTTIRLINTLLVLGEVEDAENFCSSMLREQPAKAAPYLVAAKVALMRGQLDLARRRAEALRDTVPVTSKEVVSLLEIFAEHGPIKELAPISTMFEDVVGNNFIIGRMFALTLYKAGRLREALLQSALLSNQYPEEVEPLLIMADAAASVGDWDHAAAGWRSIIPNTQHVAAGAASTFMPSRAGAASVVPSHRSLLKGECALQEALLFAMKFERWRSVLAITSRLLPEVRATMARIDIILCRNIALGALGCPPENMQEFERLHPGLPSPSPGLDYFWHDANSTPAAIVKLIDGMHTRLHAVSPPTSDATPAFHTNAVQPGTPAEVAKEHSRVAQRLAKMRKFDEAYGEITSAIRLDPHNHAYFLARGKLLSFKGELSDRTKSDLRAAVNLAGSQAIVPLRALAAHIWATEGVTDELLTLAKCMTSDLQKLEVKDIVWAAAIFADAGFIENAMDLYLQAFLKDADIVVKQRYLVLLHQVSVWHPEKIDDNEQVQRAYASMENAKGKFVELCGGARTVAVVGNSPCELGRGAGAQIDAHDIVIRFNNFSTSYPFTPDYGSKTTIWVKTGMFETVQRRVGEKFDLIVQPAGHLPFSSAHGVDVVWSAILDDCEMEFVPRKFKYELVKKLGATPSAGLLILYWLHSLNGPLSRSSIFGFSMTDQPEGGHTVYHSAPDNGAYRHNWQAERAIFDQLFAA